MKKVIVYSILFMALIAGSSFKFPSLKPPKSTLKLPGGFYVEVIADSLGAARHLAVTSNGIVYIKLAKLKNGKGIIALQDLNGDGSAYKKTGFGNYIGTGIYIKDGWLYASSNTDIYRYRLNEKGEVIDTANAEKIVTGLLDRHEHNSKSIVLDNNGFLYVNIGAYSNACQLQDRTQGSPGINPCPILDSAAGIWQFRADKTGQTYDDGVHYATGLRNVVGLDWNTDMDQLFVMQHGRDQLFQLDPNLYDAKQGAELPAETMYALHKGDNAGWPYVYYDQFQKKKILSPEYGGNGMKTGGENDVDPVAAYPGHMAPDGLVFYTGNMFPEKYRHGAFIAFHGSWNRAPEKQKGYFVVFQPFKNGKPYGNWEVFADNFAGSDNISSPAQALHRPCGLAQGPDGALYVSDDAKGTIYRITYDAR
ncbi:MAG TPA: PQQ-dependent sugar dehydrogenase [Puia sp.]|jgi:glucose/arabinose dehydrogenase|nr:PQQ-dependent sugar dehydrogenase [Puia sp.]